MLLLLYTGTVSRHLLLNDHLDPVLPGVDAGGHSEGGVGHAGQHGNHCRRVVERCREHLHWSGKKKSKFLFIKYLSVS